MSEPGVGDAQALATALDLLAARDSDLAGALARCGYPAPRSRPAGFATLLQIITAQQLSTRAAAAIWGRLVARLDGLPTPAGCLDLDLESWRAIGFSARKVTHAAALAQAVLDGRLDLEALARAPDEEVAEALVALPGFGPWSAEVYLLFALDRPDVMPAGDLALQLAFQRLRGLPERPDARSLRELTAPWAPWRGAGAVFLWHLYGSATLDGTRPTAKGAALAGAGAGAGPGADGAEPVSR